jgi:hypothetical protein
LIEEIDSLHETIADKLSRITPTQTLPLQGGALLKQQQRLAGSDELCSSTASLLGALPLDGGGLGGGEGWEGVKFPAAQIAR